MLSGSWVTGGRESQREGCIWNLAALRVFVPWIWTGAWCLLEKRLKCITWNPLFQVRIQVTVLLKTRWIPVLKKISHLYDLEVVKILCSRGKTFIQFLCAAIFVFVMSEPKASLFSRAVKWISLFDLYKTFVYCGKLYVEVENGFLEVNWG